MVSRGTGRSAVAASAYMSCSRMYNEYDGVQHDYTRKQGLVWQRVFLPDTAPREWQDRSALWNAVEEAEKTRDSRLAREFVVALPVELGRDEWVGLLTGFIQEHFAADGMCADAAIHDTDGRNPHAHILVTVRPLKENGAWQQKTEKEYLCIRDGEERGFTAAEFKTAQAEGWEKQYQYKAGKKKVYMAPSAAEAQGLERASKYPKSTKYGRQNPTAARWNSEEQLVLWREAWAAAVNRCLERSGREERVDHRSHAARGLDEQPTVHEGVIARAMEKQGVAADRCELNRQIKADNRLLRELKTQVRKLTEAVKGGVDFLAGALENLRKNMIVFRYQLRHIRNGKAEIGKTLNAVRPEMERYEAIVSQIKGKAKERKSLLEEKKALSPIQVFRQRELAQKIAGLTEDLEELQSEKVLLLDQLACEDMSEVRRRVADLEATLKKLEQQDGKYSVELTAALNEYAELMKQAEGVDLAELDAARLNIRPGMERKAAEKLQSAYGKRFDFSTMAQSKSDVAALLSEDTRPASVLQKIRQPRQTGQRQERQRKTRKQDLER